MANSTKSPKSRRPSTRPKAAAKVETVVEKVETVVEAAPVAQAAPVAARPTPSRDQIARRAYELFLSRGRQHGRQMEDWLQAEAELTQASV